MALHPTPQAPPSIQRCYTLDLGLHPQFKGVTPETLGSTLSLDSAPYTSKHALIFVVHIDDHSQVQERIQQ
jgi:hypothetical protein